MIYLTFHNFAITQFRDSHFALQIDSKDNLSFHLTAHL
jgi:hypothetical protein